MNAFQTAFFIICAIIGIFGIGYMFGNEFGDKPKPEPHVCPISSKLVMVTYYNAWMQGAQRMQNRQIDNISTLETVYRADSSAFYHQFIEKLTQYEK